MTVTDKQLAEWEALEKAATPGPWKRCSCGVETDGIVAGFNKDGPLSKRHSGQLLIFWDRTGRRKRFGEDCAFIAAARTAVPQLVAEVRRLREGFVEHDRFVRMQAAEDRMLELGWRFCDIPACNCDRWHSPQKEATDG